MEREEVLGLIQKKKWNELLSVLKDNRLFDSLANDSIFINVFNSVFINEFIFHTEDYEAYIVEYTALHNFHNSTSYKFKLESESYNKLVVILIEFTQSHIYAYELPDYELSKKIISSHEKEQRDIIEATRINHEIRANLSVRNLSNCSEESFVISIFKSPQEEEFYFAAKEVFADNILLPNVALSSVINNSVLNKLEGKHKGYFLSTTIDLVIVDPQTTIPIYFFELDSSFHDTDIQKYKDEIKNKLINEAGFELFRIRKKKSSSGIEQYITLLKEIKSSKI